MGPAARSLLHQGAAKAVRDPRQERAIRRAREPLAELATRDLVRSAAREGVVEALRTQASAAPKALTPLLDKRALAHALGVSTAKIDRLVRSGEIEYVLVGEVRRFDLDAVRVALEAQRQERDRARGSAPDLAPPPGLPSDIRLLSRAKRA